MYKNIEIRVGGKNSDEPTAPLKPLISVIVPIYNVEKYVRKCLDSLINQTMKQIEVIAIDDGSTDGSGRIADEYENPDGWPVIRVIHTNNRGLSAARNRGLDESRADWIMFVDSDDWVELKFCMIPYEAAVRENADMVIFQADTVKRGKIRKRKPYSGPVGIVDEMMAHEYGSAASWNKLYGSKLFKEIRFPEGRVAEDTATTHKIVHKSKRIYLLKECLYHYVFRRESISHTNTKESHRDLFISTIERKRELISYGYSEEKLKDSLYGTAIGYLARTNDYSDELYKRAKEVVDMVEGIPAMLNWKQKIALRAWKTDRRLFVFLCRTTGRMKSYS